MGFMTEDTLRTEIETLRAQIKELLPYAYAGAEALDAWEPYGIMGSMRRDGGISIGDIHAELCSNADGMLHKIELGVFGDLSVS